MDDELKAILTKLADRIESEATENGKFRAEVRNYMVETDKRLVRIEEHLTGIDKRQDDQSRMLAAMIPTRLAAVPGQDERRPS